MSTNGTLFGDLSNRKEENCKKNGFGQKILQNYYSTCELVKYYWIDTNFKKLSIRPPKIGDFDKWWSIFMNKYGTIVWRSFPKGLVQNVNKIEGELCQLLPNEKAVRDVLPVLMICYIKNRRWIFPIISQIYDEEYTGEKERQYFENKVYTASKYIRGIPRINEAYRVSFEDETNHSLQNPGSLFSAYRTIVIFFNMLLNAPCANISLSFYTFEEISGYLGYLDGVDALLHRKTTFDDLKQGDEGLDRKIKHYTKTMIDLFCSAQRKRPPHYPDGFDRFVLNIVGDRYSPDADILNALKEKRSAPTSSVYDGLIEGR